ncbi:MAG: hypothetical protein IPH04_00455 [Saprospirales bacterium]|nr:hypothetical protein [Saprospirales bacterium]
MKPIIFESSTRQSIVERVQRLNPDTKPNWGVMTVNQMLCHLSDNLRDMLKIRQTKLVVPGLLRPLIRLMVLTEKPWKPNSPTFKPYKQGEGGDGTPPTGFDADKTKLLELLVEFSSKNASFSFGPHAGLGNMNYDQRGYFMWKHFDHHLRQFGV